MKFIAKTEAELHEENLLEDGIYQYEVVQAEERISKSGNDMIKMKIIVWDKNGSERIVFDYLLQAMPFKLIHFCKYNGLADKYANGALDVSDCIGKSGYAKIIRQEGQSGYNAQNSVSDYVEKPKAEEVDPLKGEKFLVDGDLDSDIPF